MQHLPLAQASGRISRTPPSLSGIRRAEETGSISLTHTDGAAGECILPKQKFRSQRGMVLQHYFLPEGFLFVSSEMGKEAKRRRFDSVRISGVNWACGCAL